MFADNQFFASIERMMKDTRLRADFGLLTAPDDYETIRAQPPSAQRLPMSPGQPNTVFADEEEGAVAIKHGADILYVALYWRARMGVNGLARTHYLTPRYQQVAVVYEDAKFVPSGKVWKRPNWINFGFANGGHHYPGKIDSAIAGEPLPIAKFPADVPIPKDTEMPFASSADFYRTTTAPYLIGMNTTQEKTFELTVPAGVNPAPDLVSGQNSRCSIHPSKWARAARWCCISSHEYRGRRRAAGGPGGAGGRAARGGRTARPTPPRRASPGPRNATRPEAVTCPAGGAAAAPGGRQRPTRGRPEDPTRQGSAGHASARRHSSKRAPLAPQRPAEPAHRLPARHHVSGGQRDDEPHWRSRSARQGAGRCRAVGADRALTPSKAGATTISSA